MTRPRADGKSAAGSGAERSAGSSVTRRVLLSHAGGAALTLALQPCARTAAGRVAGDPLRRLRRAVRGELLRPGSSATLVYNERYDPVRPLAVLEALGVADVRAAVRRLVRLGRDRGPRPGRRDGRLAGRRYGLTCDNVSGLTMVTADGRVRRCDAKANEDLFWACRGGGAGTSAS